MITEGNSIKFTNLISLRGKIIDRQVEGELDKIKALIKENNAEKNGPLITSTFGVEIIDGNQVIDIEILVPINKSEIHIPSKYTFKKVFHLVHALHIREEGDLSQSSVEERYVELQGYIEKQHLQPITNFYNVNSFDQSDLMNGKTPVLDIYVGINPSTL